MANPALEIAGVPAGVQDVRRHWLPVGVTALALALLFSGPAQSLARDWWTDPESGHGLLLVPVSLWLAWKAGVLPSARPSLGLGLVAIVAAVVLRYVGGVAAETFTPRASLVLALAGVTTYCYGWRQVRAWWLPFTLFALSIPLPSLVTTALALPLQFLASAMGAALLEMRHIPVLLSGNVIRLPGHQLFVTEACSGLRSLTALLSLGVMVGGLWLRYPLSRVLLVALAIPVGIVVNAIRVFLTGFLVYFVSPKMGDGFMHLTEGWLLFLVAFGVLGCCGFLLARLERQILRRKEAARA